MTFFSNKNIDEDERRNIAFQVMVANRDLLEIAIKRSQPPTYENSIGLLNEIAPDLYKDFTELLSRKNESELSQYYNELADIQTKETDKLVTAFELIDIEIVKLRKRNELDPTKRIVKKKLMEHLVAREKMEPVRMTENRILNRDFSKIDRSTYAETHFEDDFFTDFKLKNNEILRIRFLHPDSDEHITGADLIYEQYDLKNKKVRLVFLQYKTWENNVIYKSQTKNLLPQLEKLENILCKNKLCHSTSGTKTSNKYRFPYCSGFLRPTDKIQENDSKLMSSGFHLPVCTAMKMLESDEKIEKKLIKEEAFKSHIFEELFNSNMIGSRWIDLDKIEEIYNENEIFEKSDRIRLYAQEFIN